MLPEKSLEGAEAVRGRPTRATRIATVSRALAGDALSNWR
jgi:hypothetical protein